ncbi:MAG: hypothetical protein ABJN52_00125 [Litorimonas sp.]
MEKRIYTDKDQLRTGHQQHVGNIADASCINWGTNQKQTGALWVQQQEFWLFGTITFFEQGKGFVAEDRRSKQMQYLFNATDRDLLRRKHTHTDLKRHDRRKGNKLKQQCHKQQVRDRYAANRRLERLVYDESGRNRDFPHAHFFIKGTARKLGLRQLQELLITNSMTDIWSRFGTIDFRANSNSVWQTGYGYKEENKQAEIGTFNHSCSYLH